MTQVVLVVAHLVEEESIFNMKKKDKKFKQDRVHEWFEDHIGGMGLPGFLFFFLLSLMGFFLFWGQCTQGNTCVRLSQMNFLVSYLIIFFIVLELIYIWFCKNEEHLEEDDVFVFKTISFFLASIIINLITPLIYGIIYSIYLVFTKFVVQASLIIFWSIIGVSVLYGFYRLNKWILKLIKKYR